MELKFINEFLKLKPISSSRNLYFEYVVRFVNDSYDWAEFGVASGRSALQLLKYLPSNKILYLFDSFRGLPENWGLRMKKGYFNLKVLPTFTDKRAVVVQGLFQDTLSKWKAQNPAPLSLAHFDCDLYSSTACAFKEIGDKLIKGTVILFDEFHNYSGFEVEEYKAFIEFIGDRKFKFLARTTHEQAAIILEE